MSNFQNLKNEIANTIKANGNNDIDGALLQEKLLEMVDSLGKDYKFRGVATPDGEPITDDTNVFYVANTVGTYPYYGGLAVADGEIAFFCYNGSWGKTTFSKVAQELGDSENMAVSQKVVTEEFEEMALGISILDIVLGKSIDVTEWKNGNYINTSSSIGSFPLFSTSRPILLNKGYKIEVKCSANTAVSAISTFDEVTNTYESKVVGISENVEKYEYIAMEDCNIVISYRNTIGASYIIVESDTINNLIDRIEIQSDIVQGLEYSKNLVNPNKVINNWFISASNGEIYKADNWILSGLIKVKPNALYYVKRTTDSTAKGCRFLTKELNILKPLTKNGEEFSSFEIPTSYIVLAPSNAAYMQVQIKTKSGGEITDCIVAESDVEIPYQPYVIPTGYDNYAKLISSEGKNLFNKNTIIEGEYISNNDGSLYPYEGWAVSEPIKVEVGHTYTFSGIGNTIDARGLSSDKKTKIKLIEGSKYWQIPTCITIPNGVDYIQFTVRTTSIDYTDTAQIEEGYIATEYEEYQRRKIIPFENLPYQLQNKDKNSLSSDNMLYGKIVSFNGDSICQGAENSGGYGKIIAQRNGMIYENIGIGGGTITAETYTSSNIARHWISRTISNMRSDADYAIVEGGVNDASLGLPLGSITEGYSDNYDDTTFYGAFESMLRQLTIRFAGKKIGYIAVHQMTTNFSVRGDKEINYYWAAKKCCEKWGVPFCDLNISVPPFDMFSDSDMDLKSLKDAYFYNSDGWHPNEEGYKKYYCDKIEAWMKTL